MIFLDNIQEVPVPTHCSSIYFLLLDGVVVYVGQSTNYLARIAQHKQEKTKNFNSFKVCELPYGADVNFAEFVEIANRKPVYNCSLPALDFLLTASDIKKMCEETQRTFDLENPDYRILMPKAVYSYWKMGGFESMYSELDMCRGLEKKEIKE